MEELQPRCYLQSSRTATPEEPRQPGESRVAQMEILWFLCIINSTVFNIRIFRLRGKYKTSKAKYIVYAYAVSKNDHALSNYYIPTLPFRQTVCTNPVPVPSKTRKAMLRTFEFLDFFILSDSLTVITTVHPI